MRQAYGPYGEGTLSTASDLRHGYAGHWWDTETGLIYMRARYYSRTLGRFMTPDPIGYGDGLNLYRYAGNAPTVYWDPWGLNSVSQRNVGRTETISSAPAIRVVQIEFRSEIKLQAHPLLVCKSQFVFHAQWRCPRLWKQL